MTECTHAKVIVYSRMISIQTLYEPAEYAFKIVCNECGEEFDETPEGAEEKEAEWEDDCPE